MSRRLAAILAADVAGYSRLMGIDEAGTLAALNACIAEAVEPAIAHHEGRLVKRMGDGLLVEFSSAVQAVTCAAAIQQALARRDAPEDRRIRMRIGVNIGDIIAEGDDIFGDGVNIAARLEAMAEPGGVCISETVLNHVRNKVGLGFESLGEHRLKNIAQPVRIYRLAAAGAAAATAAPTRRAGTRAGRGIALAAALGLVVAAGALAWLQPWAPREEPASIEAMAFPLPDKPSIAVLPFDNMSADPGQDYFADGMTEDLITDLSKISGLFVIARNSSFAYKGRAVKIGTVAEELGVRFVLEGSVQRAGDRVRINVQLIDATTGFHIWADRYDGGLDDVFRLQDSVAAEIIAALAVTLTGAEVAQRQRHPTENALALDAYLKGWAEYKLQTPEALKAALPFFEQAIRLDPGYSQAQAALAATYWDAFRNDWAFDLRLASFQAEERANAHLEQAMKAPTPLAHALEARIMAAAGLYDLAVTEAETAVALDANDATAHAGLAEALIFADRADEALGPIETAMRLDPHFPPSYLVTLGAAQFGAARLDAAAETFKRAAARNPDSEIPLVYLAATYAHLGRLTKAETTIESANELRGRHALGPVSLEPNANAGGYSPFTGAIELDRFGGPAMQQRLREGLLAIPAIKWQYLVKVTTRLTESGKYVGSYTIDGATEIDLATAKAFHDRGVLFVDESYARHWRAAHIPGSVNLSFYPDATNPTAPLLKQSTLAALAGPTDEIVFCFSFSPEFGVPWGPAKALAWGYRKVYYFTGGVPAWKAAGYPVETAE